MPGVTRSFSESERARPPQRRALYGKRPAHRAKPKGRRKQHQSAAIGELLRAWRKRNKLSQSKAAIKLGISTRTLQNWEQAHRQPRGFAAQQLQDRIR